MAKVCFPVPVEPSTNLFTSGQKLEDVGIINQHGLNHKHIFDSVKANLKRLQMEYIDVLHAIDLTTTKRKLASLPVSPEASPPLEWGLLFIIKPKLPSVEGNPGF
ncbi:hypothetical protein V8D89_004230 [Ganoderma adspersum]